MGRVISLVALIVGAVTLGGLALGNALPTSAGQSKTSVCHVSAGEFFNFGGDGVDVPVGHVITIADPALPSHIEHGDTADFDEMAVPSGQVSGFVPSDTVICVSDTDTDNDGVPDYLDNCYTDGVNSFEVDGAIGTPFRTGRFGTVDCSGTRVGDDLETTFLVSPMDVSIVEAICATIATNQPAVVIETDYWTNIDLGYDNALTDWWLCSLAAPDPDPDPDLAWQRVG